MKGLSTWQWLTMVGIFVTATATITVFAFGAFDPKGSSEAVDKKYDKKLERIERRQERMDLNLLRVMDRMGVQPIRPSTEPEVHE